MVNRPNIDVVDYRSKLHEMLAHMVDAQVALGEARSEMNDLRDKLRLREDLQALESDMDFQVDGGYYVRKSEASKGVIAYCPVCLQIDKLTVHQNTEPGRHRCSVHSFLLKGIEYKERAKAKQASLIPALNTSRSWMG